MHELSCVYVCVCGLIHVHQIWKVHIIANDGIVEGHSASEETLGMPNPSSGTEAVVTVVLSCNTNSVAYSLRP